MARIIIDKEPTYALQCPLYLERKCAIDRIKFPNEPYCRCIINGTEFRFTECPYLTAINKK